MNMYTLLKPLPVRAELLNRDIKLFTPTVFQRAFNNSTHREGLLVRLKQGLYALNTDLPAVEVRELKQFLPKSQWAVVRKFKTNLEREIVSFL